MSALARNHRMTRTHLGKLPRGVQADCEVAACDSARRAFPCEFVLLSREDWKDYVEWHTTSVRQASDQLALR